MWNSCKTKWPFHAYISGTEVKINECKYLEWHDRVWKFRANKVLPKKMIGEVGYFQLQIFYIRKPFFFT